MKKTFLPNLLIFLAFGFLTLGLIIFPAETASAAAEAIVVCGTKVIPSLFPFLFISKAATALNIAGFFRRPLNKIMRPLFKLGGECGTPLILGITGGYPTGAAAAAELYAAGRLKKPEAERLLAFCNNCGPGFVIGAVGYGVFSSAKLGIFLFIIHILSSLFVGIVLGALRPVKLSERASDVRYEFAASRFSSAFTSAVDGALKSSLSVCAYIVLFSVIACIAKLMYVLPFIGSLISSVLPVPAEFVSAFISGVLEVTSGIRGISETVSPNIQLTAASFLLGWGGFSVHAQTLGVLEGSGLSAKEYFTGKLMHGILSAVFTFFAVEISGTEVCSAFAAEPAYVFHGVNFAIFLPFLAFIILFCKKGWKKTK